ncbi:MAG TPA: ABC transporter permease [Polyangia bacterium]|nr:ABC transporter permease [Polyangia bacterium]
MTAALVRKELRQLLPVILGLASLLVWSEASAFLLHPPDQYLAEAEGWLLNSHAGRLEAVFTLILGLVVAYNLLPGEHDQRTIEFLYTLPVRRRTLFLTKYAVGVGLLVALSLLGTAASTIHHALNASSFGRQLYPPRLLLLKIAAGDIGLSFVVVAYGMLLSFFRRLGWILFLLLWLSLEVGERLYPPLRVLNIRSLLDVDHQGLTPLVDGRAWLVQGAMAALSLALAARLWLSDAGGFAGFYDQLRKQVGLRRAGVALGLLAATLASGALMLVWVEAPPSDEPGLSQRTLTFETERFHFTYREGRADRAMVIIREADRAYRRVRTWLPGPDGDGGDRIVADLTDASSEHLGIAGWKKLRIDLRPSSPALLRHVLYHETSHVLAAQPGELPERQAGLRFFSEGLAEYVAYELEPQPEEREHARRMAALARTRYQLHVEDLMSPGAFVARHDEFLLYALGEVWVAGLVEACGPQLPARLVATFADPTLPRSLAGLELWRAALQRHHCDLDRVMSRYEQRLRRLEPSTNLVPLASARLVDEEAGRLVFEVVVVEAPTPGPWQVTVRLRDDPGTPVDDWVIETFPVTKGTPQRLPVRPPVRQGQRFEFQVGAAKDDQARPFFTRWQSVTR